MKSNAKFRFETTEVAKVFDFIHLDRFIDCSSMVLLFNIRRECESSFVRFISWGMGWKKTGRDGPTPTCQENSMACYFSMQKMILVYIHTIMCVCRYPAVSKSPDGPTSSFLCLILARV